MTRGFDANVPARKPKTKISRVISELTSGAVAPAMYPEVLGAADPVIATQENTASELALEQPVAPEPPPARHSEQAVHPPTRPPAHPPSPAPKPASRSAASGKERIARLRERLVVNTNLPAGLAEPQRTAAAVREMVDGLRARLEASIEERSQLAGQLEEASAALSRSEGELKKERRARASLEAQAQEHRRIADDAVSEAEALAAERDQVLDEIAELRRLDGDQASLLKEAEAALARRSADMDAKDRELAETRQLLDLRAAQVADLETRLQEALAVSSRAEAHSLGLKAEVERLSAAGEALESLEALMRRS